MKCLICGRTCLPGAKLCSDCSSARKRAFAATVTQPLLDAAVRGRRTGSLLRPSQSVAATARRVAERTLHAKPPAAEPPVPASRRLQRVYLVAGLVGMAFVAGLVARHMQNSEAADAPQNTEATGSALLGAPPHGVSVVPAGLAPKNVAETKASDLTGRMPTTELAPPPVKRPSPKPRAVPVDVPAVPVEEALPSPTVAAAPLPPPAPEVSEQPRPDPSQLLNEGLARCASGDLFSRILCDQRVRREYCDGRWGQVPQCSSNVGSEHGQ
jgi:hypothetical protein